MEMGYRADKAAQVQHYVQHYDSCTLRCSCACHARSIDVRHTTTLTSIPGWRPPVFRPDLIFHHTLGCMRFIGQIKSLLSLDNTFCRRSGGPAAGGLRPQLGCWTTKKMSQNCSHQPQPRQHLWQAQPPTLRPLQCSRMWRSSIAATRTMAPQRLRFPSLRGPTSLCPGAQAPPEWNRS